MLRADFIGTIPDTTKGYPGSPIMIIDAVSDLHGYYPQLEGGDLLVVAGDFTAKDGLAEHLSMLEWLEGLPYTKKVLVAGNHDNLLANNPEFYSKTGIEYLCDSGTEFEGLKIWGSPWTLAFDGMNPKCAAFTDKREVDLAKKWSYIPEDTDILVTHGPPWGILDEAEHAWECSIVNTGSLTLRRRIEQIKPRFHIFGHIHEAHGYMMLKHQGPNTHCYNVSLVNERYKPTNKVTRIKL